MSRLELDKINFEDSHFVVEISGSGNKKKGEEKRNTSEPKQKEISQEELELNHKITELKKEIEENKIQAELILNRAKDEAQNLVDKAKKETDELINSAQNEANEIKNSAIEKAQNEANEIIQNAKTTSQKEAQELIESSKEQIEQERIETTKQGYEDGYKDGKEHIQEELEEKINDFNLFCNEQYEVRDKILKSANKDILDLIINISRKVLLAEVNSEKLEKIIKSAISLLEKKENVNIILSEKYAKLLFEQQKKALADETEFNFEDFKQYENFDVIYNPEFDDDTIIVENLKERYDASINSQLDVIIRNIYDNTQNGKLNLEQYLENEAE